MTGPRWPETDQEWHDAVAAAVWCLAVDSAVQYGLVTTDMAISVERCEELLDAARARGVRIPAVEEVIG